MTHYYGFSKYQFPSKLAHVVCYTEQSQNDCKNIGLISQLDFCCDEYEDWDKVPKDKYKNSSLGPGIMNFDIYTMPYDLADWMLSIRDNVLLRNVALPGSHDAGTAQSVEVSGPWVRTQAYSVITQLIMGIRAFDIRPTRAGNTGIGRDDGTIWTHHSGFKGEKLTRALNCVRIFLQTYPSETVVFILSHYENVSSDDVLEVIRQSMGNLLVPYSSQVRSLTVGETRGRLLAVEERYMERHLGPNGHDGTNDWNVMLQHLRQIQPNPNEFNRFVTALTPQKSVNAAWQTPKRLALDRGLPGLSSWLQSEESDKIGIVETDWFGSCADVVGIVRLIVDKNKKKGNQK